MILQIICGSKYRRSVVLVRFFFFFILPFRRRREHQPNILNYVWNRLWYSLDSFMSLQSCCQKKHPVKNFFCLPVFLSQIHAASHVRSLIQIFCIFCVVYLLHIQSVEAFNFGGVASLPCSPFKHLFQVKVCISDYLELLKVKIHNFIVTFGLLDDITSCLASFCELTSCFFIFTCSFKHGRHVLNVIRHHPLKSTTEAMP